MSRSSSLLARVHLEWVREAGLSASLGQGWRNKLRLGFFHARVAVAAALRRTLPPPVTARLPPDGHEVTISQPGELTVLHEILIGEEYASQGDPRTILDVGANVGLASLYFSRRPSKRSRSLATAASSSTPASRRCRSVVTCMLSRKFSSTNTGNTRMKSSLGAVLALALSTASASAAQIYVASNGTDNSSCGSYTSPCLTITYAGSTRASTTNNEVIVRGGKYNATVSLSASGNITTTIWVHVASGEHALIDGTGLGISRYGDLVAISGSYVKFDGFEVANSGGYGIHGTADNITITNNTVHDNYSQGIVFDSSGGGSISNNTVYLNTKNNSCLCTNWGQGISAFGRNPATVTNNLVYDNYGEGIGLRSNNSTVSNNTVYDNFSVNIYIDGANSSTINANFTYCTGDSRFRVRETIGIGTAIELSGHNLNGNTYTNNVDVRCKHGFRYWDQAHYAGLVNNTIVNNTWVNETVNNVQIDASSGGATNSGNKLQNNISYNTVGGTTLAGGSTQGVSYDRNLWYNNGTNSGSPYNSGTADVTSDPNLSNVGATVVPGLAASNYRLTASSPAANAGANASVATNLTGAARLTNIGATDFSCRRDVH
jgi:parallel beta-helix repeat protein